jgi:hypothetical protein
MWSGAIQSDVKQQGHTPMAGWANKFATFASSAAPTK